MTDKPKSPSNRPPPPTFGTTNRPPANLKDALAEARAVSGAGMLQRPSSLPPTVGSTGRKVIMIVDADASMRSRLKSGLEAHYEVIEAKDGMEAVEMSTKIPLPAMIVCDVVMPRLDGFTLAKIMKANPTTKRVPIMFVSSGDSPADVTQALVVGACQYVLKSVPIPEIVAKIRKIVC